MTPDSKKRPLGHTKNGSADSAATNPPSSTATATATGTAHNGTTIRTEASDNSSSSLASLLSWLRGAGIWWDERLVQIRAGASGCSGPGLGVFAVSDVTENQVRKVWHVRRV